MVERDEAACITLTARGFLQARTVHEVWSKRQTDLDRNDTEKLLRLLEELLYLAENKISDSESNDFQAGHGCGYDEGYADGWIDRGEVLNDTDA
jgi:hypothetical protein